MRIFIGIVLPPPVAAMIFALLSVPFPESLAAFVEEFSITVLMAFFGGTVQSVVYSLLMELCVWRLVGTGYIAILASGLLGIACGMSIYRPAFGSGAEFLTAGFVAGVVTGAVLRHMKRAVAGRRVGGTPSDR
jgi:VIT1/CCC1 family predicted Fe2+/Mn2+ transporter